MYLSGMFICWLLTCVASTSIMLIWFPLTDDNRVNTKHLLLSIIGGIVISTMIFVPTLIAHYK